MTVRLLGTGAELRPALDPPEPAAAGEVGVEVQVFADIEEDGRRARIGGTLVSGESVPAQGDPTSALVRLAYEAREVHLGDLLGDLRRGGHPLERFEFYAAPFAIELADELRAKLPALPRSTSWLNQGRPA